MSAFIDPGFLAWLSSDRDERARFAQREGRIFESLMTLAHLLYVEVAARLKLGDDAVTYARVLGAAYGRPATDLASLSNELGLSVAGISVLVRRAVDQGDMTRERSYLDARRLSFALTAQGETRADHARHTMRWFMNTVLAEFSGTDRDRLEQLCARLQGRAHDAWKLRAWAFGPPARWRRRPRRRRTPDRNDGQPQDLYGNELGSRETASADRGADRAIWSDRDNDLTSDEMASSAEASDEMASSAEASDEMASSAEASDEMASSAEASDEKASSAEASDEGDAGERARLPSPEEDYRAGGPSIAPREAGG